MKIIMKLLAFLLEPGIVKEVAHIERNIRVAPDCCNNPMQYLGEHSGMYSNTQFYQCQECKQLKMLHKHDWEKE